MKLGVPLAEYDRTVGPANRYFHELAETVTLRKEGVLPLDPDDADDGMPDPGETVSPDDGVPTFDDVATHGRDT